jgi:hypothetical protein
VAYLDDTVNEPVYSTVSVGRCIGDEEPWVLDVFSGTKKLNSSILNINSIRYQGRSRSSLLSEPIYNYRFYCVNTSTNEIIQDTGFLLHNADTDNITVIDGIKKRNSIHDFVLEYEL